AIGQGHATAISCHIPKMPGESFGDIEKRFQRAKNTNEMPDFLSRAEHHAKHREFWQRQRQLLDALAKLAAIEWASHHGTPSLLASGGFGMVVRKDRRHVELDCCLAREKIHRFRPILDKGIDPFRVEMCRCLMLQVRSGRAGWLM